MVYTAKQIFHRFVDFTHEAPLEAFLVITATQLWLLAYVKVIVS